MLSAADLAVGRGGVPVLEGLNFELNPGQAMVLRGPNGAGKTTLLRTVMGLQAPLAGSVDVDADTLAYAAHADGIKPSLTVAENLEFWAEVFATQGIDAAVEAFALEGLMDRPAAKLSAGQKRRLGLARLLVTGRPIWVMDEPTVSLDAQTVAALAALLQARLAKGCALLIATHIDLGFEAEVLDVSPYRAVVKGPRGFDEAFV